MPLPLKIWAVWTLTSVLTIVLTMVLTNEVNDIWWRINTGALMSFGLAVCAALFAVMVAIVAA